ncbi:MAG: DUF3306 domain-containing protein [Pseudomonadota bacterium]
MTDSSAENESLFARWSKRRKAVAEHEAAEREEASAADVAVLRQAGTEGEPPAEAEETDEQALERLGLPDPDTLEEGDDFSAFMGSAIPTRLRNRALRRLWLTNPVLANLDELVDYGEDFTDAATVIENLQTAYQVGRGFLTEEEQAGDGDSAEEDDTAASADLEATTEPQSEDAPTEDTGLSSEPPTDIAAEKETDQPQPVEAVESAADAIPPPMKSGDIAETGDNATEYDAKPKSRMRFRFDSA